MRKIGSVVAMLAVLVGVVAASAGATHSWGGYHWARTANPFALKLGDNVDANWDSYLATTSSGWSQSTVLDTPVVPGLTSGRKCRATLGRVEVCNAAYGKNGWLGLAQIWLSSGHISQGVAKMNDTYFNLAKYNTPDEKNHVMCQEVGHTLGLDHTSTDGSSQGTCMDYSTSPSSTAPNAHDYEELGIIYSHLDGSTTVGAVAPGKGGKPFAEANPRNGKVYVDDMGNGVMRVTFVYWADEG
ncbi:Pregnancy-associated plasma protein-A [Gaiella occulta]|uniref:Pregnancy-associated plasma protein-A n=1 Tax=Gaiella occulta TaxID=1002870 RepID=A0A7M2YYN5_9ACTN|nr:hypothetical protein [Gaiella occulta]RDI74587.1 Pregnancy-associated plasma protein-A [Gaiella occulta]